MKYLKAELPTNAIICFTSKVSLIIPLAERQGLPRQCDRNTVLVREGFEGEYELTDFPSLLFYVILKEGWGWALLWLIHFSRPVWYKCVSVHTVDKLIQLSLVIILARSLNKNSILISQKIVLFYPFFVGAVSINWRIILQISNWTAVMLIKVMQMYLNVNDKTKPTPSVKTWPELLRDTSPVLHSCRWKNSNRLSVKWMKIGQLKMFYHNHWSKSVSTSHYLVQKYYSKFSCNPAALTKWQIYMSN